MPTARRAIAPLGFCVVVVAVFFCRPVASYPTYHPANNNDGCFQCHDGFDNRGPLHDLHVGANQMTTNCILCHTTIGDNPKTNESGGGVSCIGCHRAPGLRLHHLGANVNPDGAGRTCATCHPGDTSTGENVLPPYYGRTDVNISDPCITDTASGGEDWDGDTMGLDNDGDQLYEQNDPDCSTAVERSTWATIKNLFR